MMELPFTTTALILQVKTHLDNLDVLANIYTMTNNSVQPTHAVKVKVDAFLDSLNVARADLISLVDTLNRDINARLDQNAKGVGL